MKRHCAIIIGAAGFAAILAQSVTTSLADPRVTDLMQASKVRVGLFLPQYIKDPASGALRGVGAHVVSIEVARAFAARLGVAAELIGYKAPPEVVGCLKTGRCDLGIMGIDPVRAAEVSLSPAFMQFDFTHLVPPGSSIRTVAQAHSPGVRIAAVKDHASTIVLARMLKDAKFIEAATPEEAFELLRAGRADTLASARPTLLDFVAALPGSRVLEGRYTVNAVALAIPKGQTGRLAYITELLDEMKRSGWLQRAIESAGLRGFEVAP